MINYATLISHVRPFFLSRGWDELAGDERMLFYANAAIQDLYNIDASTFTYMRETLVGEVMGEKMRFTTSSSIKKVQQCIGTLVGNSTIELTPTLYIPSRYQDDWLQFETGSNVILTSSNITTIEVVYTKNYSWATLNDLSSPIQLPDRYIPTVIKLMYDWASPINLMSGETAQVDFFSHAMTRAKQLADDDSLTDVYAVRSNY